MGNLISVEETKSILQISGSTNDAFINVMIPIVQDYVLKFCNLTLAEAQVYPALKLPLSQMIKYQLEQPSNISSETIGGYSVSYASTTYPTHIKDGLKQFRKAMFVTGSAGFGNYYYETWEEFSGGTQ